METNYQFRERMLQVHKPDRRMPWVVCGNDQVEVTSDWRICIPNRKDPVLYNAARDLEDYFAVSMGVYPGVAVKAEGKNVIVYRIDPALGEQKYRLVAESGRILLIGSDARSAARAGYFLEDLMNLQEGPIVDIQDTTREMLYNPRMIHSGFEMDVFPDAHIKAIAHAGITALLVYVRSLEHFEVYNDLIYRAAQYGMDVYAYSALLSRAYPEGEEGRRFYDSLYGELFRLCPGFKGVVFVGESVEFPSRDPNTTGKLRLDNIGPDGHRIIKKDSPGWYPCCDFHLWINMVKDIIHAQKPDADIIVWSYNWGYQDKEKRLELIRKLPKGISLQVTFEMFENIPKEDSYGRTVDYTLFFEGPGQYFVSEAEEAKKQGIRLYAMTNTGGLTWDMGVIPYEPAPYQWLKRYKAMKNAHDQWGLCGTMDSHHFGFYPSFIADFAKWLFEAADNDPDAVLSTLAKRDFAEECVPDVLKAWQCFSKGIENLVSTNPDQYGPMRVGSAYPLLLFKDDFVFRSRPGVVHGGNTICMPMYNYDISTPDKRHKLECEIRWYTKSAAFFDEGAALLEATLERIHPNKRYEASLQANMARFIACAIRTAVNTKKWYLEKQILISDKDAEQKREAALRMRRIGREEIENAENAITFVRYDSRLGYEPSMEYMADESHIREKIAATEKVLAEELAEYL